MNNQGWDRLLCSYFYMVCMRILSEYFSGYGFVPDKNKVGGVIFRKNDIFVELSYNPESFPKYSPTLVIGFGAGTYDDWGKFIGVPIWSLIPTEDEGSEFSTWTFSNENELGIILSKTKTLILEPYIKLLWKDRNKLEKEITKFTKKTISKGQPT